jgi:hypothetical protein
MVLCVGQQAAVARHLAAGWLAMRRRPTPQNLVPTLRPYLTYGSVIYMLMT